MERHILVILPHPDDEAFGLSGTLASHIAEGTPVTYACLTLGEMGRNMGVPVFASRETLPRIRRRELINACLAIGITDLRMFGLRDKTVEFEDKVELNERITRLIKEVHPSLIFTFYPGFAVHPDHDAAGAAVIRAVKQLPEDERPVVYCMAFSKGCEEYIGAPDIIHDVSEFAEQKLATIFSHQSQTQFFQGRLNGKTSAADPEVLKMLRTERFWTYPMND